MATITVDQLLSKVLSKMQDTRFVNSDVIMSFNSCCSYLSSMLDIRQLATVATVNIVATNNNTELPEDYQKKLHKAFNITSNRELYVFESRVLIDRKIDRVDESGEIIAVAPDAGNLYCQRIPTTDQDIRIYYFAFPTLIEEEEGEFPTWIPSNFLNGLFYHYTVSDLYNQIEDGINGEKVNTVYHDAKFQEEFERFKTYIGPYPDHPYIMTSENVDFDFGDV